ncbi:MAG: KpsF/GutQ family sugar-phosphate isomerase [Thiotrichales bacterium]
MKLPAEQVKALAREVIEIESRAVAALGHRINGDFVSACEHLYDCKGRIVVTGMGKSGHIGGKIAATLASTGSPAFFVHPGEASHGDLGMITDQDAVLAISNSGETEELLNIVPIIRRQSVTLISMTGNRESRLARQATVNLDISVEKEACPLNLAPTSSTTVTLALGDALAVSLLKIRGFTAEDFARSHPGGKLGRRLLLNVSDVMHDGEAIPCVLPGTSLKDSLMEMTAKTLGFTAICDANRTLIGVYTDGDLRRSLDKGIDINLASIDTEMTAPCQSISPDALAVDALNLMESQKINALPVTDGSNRLVGAVNMLDLLRAGVV